MRGAQREHQHGIDGETSQTRAQRQAPGQNARHNDQDDERDERSGLPIGIGPRVDDKGKNQTGDRRPDGVDPDESRGRNRPESGNTTPDKATGTAACGYWSADRSRNRWHAARPGRSAAAADTGSDGTMNIARWRNEPMKQSAMTRENADIKRIDRSDVIAEQFECEIVIVDHPSLVESQTERLAAV